MPTLMPITPASGSNTGDASENSPLSKVKVSLNLLQRDIDIVDALAEERGVSKTEVIRAAIATEKFLRDAVAKGQKVLLEDADGHRVRELVFR